MSVNIFKNGRLERIAGNARSVGGGTTGSIDDATVDFEEAAEREALRSGDAVPTLFGKIKKWLSDLKPVAFSGKLDDLNDTRTTDLALKKGFLVNAFGCRSTETYNAWVKILTIKIKSDYSDAPVEVACSGRWNASGPSLRGPLVDHLTIIFENAATTDPSLGVFYIQGNLGSPQNYYIGREGVDEEGCGVWNLYTVKSEYYDQLCIYDIKYSPYTNMEFSYPDSEEISDLPAIGSHPSYLSYASHDSEGHNIAEKLDSIEAIKDPEITERASENDAVLADVEGKTSKITFGNIFRNVFLSSLDTDSKEIAAAINELNSKKVDAVPGKQLSTEDYTTEEKEKLASLSANSGLGEVPEGLASGYVRTGQAPGTEIGDCATAEGYYSEASGAQSHAEGKGAKAKASCAHAGGWYTTASGVYSSAGGALTVASGFASNASGYGTTASGDYSCVWGYNALADGAIQMVAGINNVSYANSDNAIFLIGNGGSVTSRSNAFRVTKAGVAYGQAAFQTSGADYAELFEWADGNPNNEDRRGYFVTLDGDQIRIASPGNYVLGIISASPVVIGNSDPDNWHQRFLKDDFGNYITETITERMPIGEGAFEEVEQKAYILNPDFDESKDRAYVPRHERPEWSPVGMLGQLVVRDDGTCQVNGYCAVSEGGIATDSDEGWRVIKRIRSDLVKVVFHIR